ncbi:hypothetical protein [Jannaschia sp. R86511]|uniref:hypothetical protein n=1 Tax=Jannaschia sp. R86511 TaxID=3093853 RepID=UPI0036D20C63
MTDEPRPSQADVRADRPATVVRLVQLMWAGAVLAVLTGVYGLLSIDRAVAQVMPQLEADLAAAGVDPAAAVDGTGWLVAVGLVVSTVVAAGLWALFAWLLGRGQGRVVGTVLGAVNGVGSVWGLFQALDLLELVLGLATLAVVAAGLVLLWRPTTSAWFLAVKAADRSIPWT